MRPRLASLLCAIPLLALLAGCTPEIGDDCVTSLDCSQTGDRLCDISSPGGYCTIFNCEPDTCPEDEAVCVAFDYVLDPTCQASPGLPTNAPEWARFGRTFCMKACEENDDCREDEGYECAAPPDMLIVDTDPVASKFCLVKGGVPPHQGGVGGGPNACEPGTGGIEIPAATSSSSAGGAGGQGGSGGAGGQGGSGGQGGAGGGAGGAGGLGGAGGQGGQGGQGGAG
jgi:hypothetical protein